MIKVQKGVATREPVPDYLPKASEALVDLSWLDPQFGLQGAAWWPEEDQTPALGQDEVLDGTEVLTPDAERRVVVVVRGVRDMTAEEIRERWLQANPVPPSCSRRQGRLALLAAGHLDDVEQAIAAIQDGAERRAAQIEYEADTWERSNAFVQQMWTRWVVRPLNWMTCSGWRCRCDYDLHERLYAR